MKEPDADFNADSKKVTFLLLYNDCLYPLKHNYDYLIANYYIITGVHNESTHTM